MSVSNLVLVSVGNTRTRIARARVGGAVEPSRVLENNDPGSLIAAIAETAQGLDPAAARLLLASVNDPVADHLLAGLEAKGLPRLVRIVAPGKEGLSVPIRHALAEPVTVGVDRLLAGLAAYSRTGGACVVIDAGTAVTVNYVDDAGVFQGGVIAPGLAMSLEAMHRHTSALPAVRAPRSAQEPLPAGPLGRTTQDAMLLGCVNSIRGLAHRMIDLYAQVNNRYPRVVATGGDAPLLFENDDLVEHIVPDLLLVGMAAAWNTSKQ